ncbi:DNA-processing protein DprA [Ruania albidiflava]|uniref:DNA-processing protein DprA n=1 Tax=Ruania albidiflava TaxID=366586 RepID=UPI0023F2C4AF|nr:DNA-processing protein DprA [Ruania albidiflava]
MPDDLPFDIADDRLARAAWSRLAEPRDAEAGALLQALGAGPALDWLVRAARTWVDPPVLAAGARWHTAAQRWIPRLATLDPVRELQVLTRRGGRLIIPSDPDWPDALADLGTDTPPCLWLLGDVDVLAPVAVAVVGSRACSPYGAETTGAITSELAAEGVAIVSGGAFGVDAAAHRTTLAGDGMPVAVMAGGLDRYYPTGNAALLAEVARCGAVLSEVPPGSSPMRHRFLSRNRLIAALAEVVLVVEASWRSGALNTAGHAADLGRTVAAVPGPVTSSTSAGCHRLIREGAVCVTDAAEVLELLRPMDAAGGPAPPPVAAGLLDGLDPAQAIVLDALPARAGAELASLVRSSGLAEGEVRSALGFLELAGRVERDGVRWRRARRSAA